MSIYFLVYLLHTEYIVFLQFTELVAMEVQAQEKSRRRSYTRLLHS